MLRGVTRIALLALVVSSTWAGSGAALAQPDAAAKDRAREHFARGKAAFEIGRFADALGHYEKAYGTFPLPGFLFNIGQCHRNLGNYEKAAFAFRQYLRKQPAAANRHAVEKLIADLEQQAAEEREAARREQTKVPDYKPDPPQEEGFVAQPPPPPPREPPAAPFYKKWWFWVPIAVIAAGGGAVGTYFALRPQDPTLPESAFSPWTITAP